MKFGQRIEYSIGNIFVENSYKKVVERLVPDLFSKIHNLTYMWINCKEFYSLFSLNVHVQYYKNILKLNCWPLAFTSNKAILKNKRPGTNSPASISA